MHPVELQQRIDRELKSLPGLRAPETLLPRVLAAVRHWADRPWYARAWFTWPMWWRSCQPQRCWPCFAASALRCRWCTTASPRVRPRSIFRSASTRRRGGQRVVVIASTLRTLWVAIAGPFVAYAFLLLVLMGLLCAACAAALNRVAFGRTAHS